MRARLAADHQDDDATHGGAAFQLDGRMVDAPVLRRAERIRSSASTQDGLPP
ncbi:hypothetical protein [Hydrogenophaga defluvii]|uniref:Citrate lyase subunit beta/citryl-CoA lyase n=1 Tax=Hydrogenophaga defluvii TaxID=249410 RepID=A0ABW2SCM2_9BURK